MKVAVLKYLGIVEDAGPGGAARPESWRARLTKAIAFIWVIGTVLFTSVGQNSVSWVIIGLVACLSIPVFRLGSIQRRPRPPRLDGRDS
jgi:hypothetical protein